MSIQHPSDASNHTYAGLNLELRGLEDSRPPLVLLHQLACDHTMWAPCLDALAHHDPGRWCLAIDLPAHGDSSPHLPHTTDHLVQIIHQAVSQAGLDSPIMVGHWTSAYIAHAYAADHPVRGVIAIEPFPSLPRIAELLQSQMGEAHTVNFTEIWADIAAADFRVKGVLPPVQAAQEAAKDCLNPDGKILASYWQELVDLPSERIRRRIASDSQILESAKVPYLIIDGGSLTGRQRACIAEILPTASVEVWHRGGRFPHVAFPDRLARRLAGTGSWPAGT